MADETKKSTAKTTATPSVDVAAGLAELRTEVGEAVEKAYALVKAAKGEAANIQFGIVQAAQQAHRTLSDVELALADLSFQVETRSTQKAEHLAALEAQKARK